MTSEQRQAGFVARIARASTRAGRAAGGEFSIEGTRLVERALRACAPLNLVLHAENYGEESRENQLLSDLRQLGHPTEPLPAELVARLTGGRSFGAILGLVAQVPSRHALDPERDLLAAVDIQDPGNLGALVRTAAASGAGAVVAVGESDPFHPKAVRTSMGALFKLPILERQAPADLFETLAQSGHSTLAAVPRGGLLPWSAELPPGPHALLVGSEAHGLPAEVQAACAARVSLPQRDDLDSYSVNAAAAMLLYELVRRRAH